MKRTSLLLLVGVVLALAPVARATDRVVNTETPTGSGSLTAAINALLDGDRITFHIPPEAGEVHYIQVPPNGFPLITKNNIIVDGYTQGGATSNTGSIHAPNNAVLKIVLTATNGNSLSMHAAVTNYAGFAYPNLGFGPNDEKEMAILGFFKATNAWIKGLCIQADPHPTTTQNGGQPGDCKAFCFAPDAPDISSNACQNFHVSGCWFGLDPVTGQPALMPDGTFTVATPHMCVAAYGTGTNGTVPGYTGPTSVDASGVMGVAPGSAVPRAEFNVCITPYGFDATGGPYHISGNFWGVLPDGVTSADMSDLGFGLETSDAFCEWGSPHDVVVGTDGDGVNDADEGNIFGKYTAGDADIEFYGTQYNIVFAGNTFGADINGHSLQNGALAAGNKVLHKISADATSQIRFGSDFNGVSDALEANLVVDSSLFDINGNSSTNTHWLSMCGNSLTNTSTPTPASRPPVGDGQNPADAGNNLYTNFIDISGGGGIASIIPTIGPTTTTTSLSGVCGKPLAAPYTNLVVDVYAADPNPADQPQGQRWLGRFTDNSAADSNPAVGAFTFDITSLSIAHGTKLTIAVTYASETRPTIASVARAGSQTTVKISNPGSATYGIQKSATVSPTSWSSTGAAAVGGSATFTDSSNPKSFYRAQGSAALGQTSPFSNVFTVP